MNNSGQKKRLKVRETEFCSGRCFLDNEVDQQTSEQRGSKMTLEDRNSANDGRGHSQGLKGSKRCCSAGER